MDEKIKKNINKESKMRDSKSISEMNNQNNKTLILDPGKKERVEFRNEKRLSDKREMKNFRSEKSDLFFGSAKMKSKFSEMKKLISRFVLNK